MPRYREAYPELDIELLGRGRNVRTGDRDVVSYSESHAVVGTGELKWLEYEFLISCDVYPREYLEATRKSRRVRYDFLQQGRDSYRTCAVCPVCAKKATKLYLKNDDWACANCQGLRYRSTFIPAQQRWAEEIDNLNLETKEGRPFGMRQATYEKKVARLEELKAKDLRVRKLPAAQFMYCIYAVWDERAKQSRVNGQ
jgi:hypothetical protein